jgi:hypothetical protein
MPTTKTHSKEPQLAAIWLEIEALPKPSLEPTMKSVDEMLDFVYARARLLTKMQKVIVDRHMPLHGPIPRKVTMLVAKNNELEQTVLKLRYTIRKGH